MYTDGYNTMMELVSSMWKHLQDSKDLNGFDTIKPISKKPRSIIFCGMGGSAIAGDILRPILENAAMPVSVIRDYSLPEYVSAEDLIVLSSYSGNTEEVLSVTEPALLIGAKILVISSGGKLSDFAQKNSLPLIVLPPGMPPRSTLGYGIGAILYSMHKFSIISNPNHYIHETVELLKNGVQKYSSDQSDVAKLAMRIKKKLPVIHTTDSILHAVGERLVAQLNENSKVPAQHSCYPELNHNEVVGWDETELDCCLLVLRTVDEHSQVAKRVAITTELLAPQFAFIHESFSTGESKLAKIMSLVQFGDYLSCHLAKALENDPLPVAVIDTLKKRLSEGN